MVAGKRGWDTQAIMTKPARVLGAMFQGGGNVPLIMPIMARLVERGHSVRIMAGPGVRPSKLPISPDLLRRILSTGATVVPFYVPDPHPLDASPPTKGVLGSWVPAGFKSLPGEARTVAWATAWSLQVVEELQTAPADVVVADFVLLGALAAAEAARVPSVALMHTFAQRLRPVFRRMDLGGCLPVDRLAALGMHLAGLSSTMCIVTMHCRRSMPRGSVWGWFRFARLSNNMTAPLAS